MNRYSTISADNTTSGAWDNGCRCTCSACRQCRERATITYTIHPGSIQRRRSEPPPEPTKKPSPPYRWPVPAPTATALRAQGGGHHTMQTSSGPPVTTATPREPAKASRLRRNRVRGCWTRRSGGRR